MRDRWMRCLLGLMVIVGMLCVGCGPKDTEAEAEAGDAPAADSGEAAAPAPTGDGAAAAGDAQPTSGEALPPPPGWTPNGGGSGE